MLFKIIKVITRNFSGLFTFLFFLTALFIGEASYSFAQTPETIRIPDYDVKYSSAVANLYDETIFDSFMKKIAEKNNWQFEKEYARTQIFAYQNLKNGYLDLLYGVYKNSLWEYEGLHYSQIECGQMNLVLLAKESDYRFTISDFSSLHNIHFGYESGNPIVQEAIENFEKENNIKFKRTFFGSRDQVIRLLQDGTLDVVAVSITEPVHSTKILYSLETIPLYFASFDEDLITKIDASADDVFKDNSAILTSIFSNQLLPKGINFQNLTEEEKRFLNKHPELTVIIPELKLNSEVQKVRKEMFTRISGITAISFDYKSYFEGKNITNATFNTQLFDDKNKVYLIECINDIVISTDSTRYIPEQIREHGKYIKTTGTFYEQYIRLIYKNDGFMNRRFTLAVTPEILKSLPYFYEEFRNLQKKNVIVLENTAQCLKLLASDGCDAILVNDFELQNRYKISDYISLRKSYNTLYTLPVSLACISNSEEDTAAAVSILNKSINLLPYNFHETIENTTGISITHKIPQYQIILQTILFISISAFILLLTITLISEHHSKFYKEKASKDPLTEVLNSMGFEKQLCSALSIKGSEELAVIEYNIHNFARANKLQGTVFGDAALIQLAGMLTTEYGKNCVSRSFGDTFYVYVSKNATRSKIVDETYQFVQKLQFDLSRLMSFNFIIKTGIAFSSEEYIDCSREAVKLLSNADFALKTKGSSIVDNFSVFDAQLSALRDWEEHIEETVGDALKNDEFYVVYQPKNDLKTGKIKGAEALVRWKTKEGVNLMPDTFIGILEKNGFIEQLDFYVYRKTFDFLQELNRAGKELVPVSLNVSRLCYNTDEFADKFFTLFFAYDIPPECIELEIEERYAAIQDTKIQEITQLFQNAGFKVSIDDFGTGESSFNMLDEINVDIVKIDKKFIRNIEYSDGARIILSTLITMLKKLGKKVLCEGVETQTQVDLLNEMSCDLAQGYFYSVPLKKEDFAQYLEENI